MNTKLKYIIGGSASSGSSLLAHLLNNHSQIYCGPETNIFTNRKFLQSWKKHKTSILSRKGEYNTVWHVHRGMQLSHLSSDDQLKSLINESLYFSDFVKKLISLKCENENKEFFSEKTPSNSVLFHTLSDEFPDSTLVLTVRNPFDAIASMINRGWSIPYAAGLYLINISFGLSVPQGLKVVKYEDLIENPESTLTHLLGASGLNYEPDMLQDITKMEKLPSWGIKKLNALPILTTFNTLDNSVKRKVVSFINHLSLKENFKIGETASMAHNILDLMRILNYDLDRFKNQFKDSSSYSLKLILYAEYLKRTLRGYPFGFSNFPFEIR